VSSAQTISTGYVPRPLQAPLHKSLKRFSVLVCHRRWGKTIFSINEMIDRGLRLYTAKESLRPRYAYIAPTYGQAKKIAWDVFKSYCGNIPGVTFNEQELRVDISLFGDIANTLRFQLLGAENPDSLRGIGLDGVIVDEPAQTPPGLWSEVIRPTLLDRKGWAIFIGTPKGRNSFYDFYERARTDPEWFTQIYRASETNIIEKSELEALRKEMGDEAYAQEMECSWEATNKGRYFGPLMADLVQKGRITRVPYDPNLGVMTAWDLGIGDSTAIWFAQRAFRELHLIDYMEVDGLGLPEIARKIKEKPYPYTTHLLPHDAAARELGTGKTRQEVLNNLGIRADVLPRQKVDDGIQAMRNLLQNCCFDEDKTYRGIECLREYRREWDEKAGMFKNKPLHNQFSHGADAFRQLAMGIDRERPLVQPERQTRAITEYNEFGGF
jgi:phage terminase large subunit